MGSGRFRFPLRTPAIGVQCRLLLILRFTAEYFCFGDDEHTVYQLRESVELGRRIGLHVGMILPSPERARWMTPATPFERVIYLDCGNEDSKKCRIFLPRRNPEETLGSAEYLSLFEWPITIVCLHHVRMCVRSADTVRDAAPGWGRDQPTLLWRVEVACAREGCARVHTIYAGAQPTAESVKAKILQWRPEIACAGHGLIWKEDMVHVSLVAYNSPTR